MHPITSARYLGVIVDENVNWKKHLNDTSHKLIQGNVILCKIRNYVNKATLRTLFCNFHSYINYVPIAPGNTNHVQQRISLLQRKALRIMHFVQFDSDTSALFYNSKLLTFFDVIYSVFKILSSLIIVLIKIPLQFLLKIIIYALYPYLQYQILK